MRRSTNLALVGYLGLLLLVRNAWADLASPGVAPGDVGRSSTGDKLTARSDAIEQLPAKGGEWTADFSLLEEYRLRIASDRVPSTGPLGEAPQRGQQTDQHLRLLGDGQVTGWNDHFRAVMSSALWFDLDGAAAAGSASVFATQYDNAQPWLAVYALSAEWQKHKTLDYVRVGRQASEHGLPLTFDGASLAVRALGRRLQLFAFGGRTAHFFETTPGFFENWLASTGAVLRPDSHVTFELDTRLIHDRTWNTDRSQRDPITNHSYGITAALGSENLSSKIYARGLDRRPSHVGGGFAFHSERLGLGFLARVHAQLVTLGEVVESENPFYSLLGPSLPHARYRFEWWKDFQIGRQANWGVHLGWRGRRVVGASERPFNRNTGAIYLHTQIDDFVRKGLFLGGTLESNYLHHPFERERLLAFGGNAGYGNQLLKAEVGTYFQQYKIIYYQSAEELHNARTVYGSVGFTLAQWLQLRGRYEIDVFDRYLQSFFLSARQDL
jgi:hypothetical protein